MTRRDGRQSGVLATLLIAKDCSLQRRSGHILAEEYSKITLARKKNNIIHLCGKVNRRSQELKQPSFVIFSLSIASIHLRYSSRVCKVLQSSPSYETHLGHS